MSRSWRPAAAGLVVALLAGSICTAEPTEAIETTAARPAPPADLEQYAEVELDNGLRLLLGKPRRPALLTEVLVVIRSGSEAKEAGAKNAREKEAAWIAAETFLSGSLGTEGTLVRRHLARLGASADYTVGKQATVFRFTVPTRLADELMEVLAALLSRPSPPAPVWQQAAAYRGQLVAREEVDPWHSSTRLLDSLLWERAGQSPPTAAPTPAASSIEPAAARQEPAIQLARARLRETYRPSHTIVAAWGELDVEATAETARRLFSRVPNVGSPPGAAAPPSSPTPAPKGVTRCLQRPGATPPALLIGFGAEIEDDVDFFGWQVLAHILGSSNDSRLYRRLRLHESLAYTVEASCLPVGDRGLTLRIACQTPDLERSHRAVLDELHRIASEEVSQEELDLARSIFRSRLLLDQGSLREQFYQHALRLLGTPSARDALAGQRALDQLTPERLLRLARGVLVPERASVVVVSETPSPLCTAPAHKASR